MRTFGCPLVRILVLSLLVVGTHIAAWAQVQRAAGPGNDSAAWKKAADSFMADLVANRTNAALDRMEPEFIKGVGGRIQAKSALEKLFDYCGRPLDSEFKHEERGFKQYLTGQRKEMRKFYYAATTNQFPKGVCFFAVDIVPSEASEYKVTTFGPLKLTSGKLPDWLK